MAEQLEVTVNSTNQKVQFTGVARSNPAITMDYTPPLGDGQGYMPLELLLMSLATCSGATVAMFVLLASKLRTGREALLIVPPDTVLRWHLISFRRTISSSERCSCSSSSSWPRDAWYTMV